MLKYSDTFSEKAVICKSFVCYVHILFVCFDCIRLYLVNKKTAVYKQSKLVRLHCSSCGHVIDTSLQSFTLFRKWTLADIMILWLLKLGITILIHNEFVTEFPCFLGHPVQFTEVFLIVNSWKRLWLQWLPTTPLISELN